MKDLIHELIPHAPKMGLFLAPHIPQNKLRNACADYASEVRPAEVQALYDATLMGSAKDGALFLADRLLFQNNNLEPAEIVRYADIVGVSTQRKLISGRKVCIEVNRGRATIELTIDFSGKPDAATFVARFLNEAMQAGAAAEMGQASRSRTGKTDLEAVRQALEPLREQGKLTEVDFERILHLLHPSE